MTGGPENEVLRGGAGEGEPIQGPPVKMDLSCQLLTHTAEARD